MGAGVKAAEHGRYTTPTDDVRRRHGLLPPRTGLIYRIMMAHGGVPHSHGELIHRSAWNRNSRKFISKILYSPAPIPRNAPPPGAPHSPAWAPLVTLMDRYARLRMLPCHKQIFVVAVISEGRSDPSHTLLRGSGRAKAKGRSY